MGDQKGSMETQTKKFKRMHLSSVQVNVGGKRFDLSRSFLEMNKGTRLSHIVSDRCDEEPRSDNGTPIYIDRDGNQFSYVLDYLRQGFVHLPVAVSEESFVTELTFYGVKAHESKIFYSQQAQSDQTRFKQLRICERSLAEKISELKEEQNSLEIRKAITLLATTCYARLISGPNRLVLTNLTVYDVSQITGEKQLVHAVLECLGGNDVTSNKIRNWFNGSTHIFDLQLKAIDQTSASPASIGSASYTLEFEDISEP
jgi:hypothetical protein